MRPEFLQWVNRHDPSLLTDPLLTPGEVANMFAVDVKTVSRWCRSGKLPGLMTPGGNRRFRLSDVEAAIAKTAGR